MYPLVVTIGAHDILHTFFVRIWFIAKKIGHIVFSPRTMDGQKLFFLSCRKNVELVYPSAEVIVVIFTLLHLKFNYHDYSIFQPVSPFLVPHCYLPLLTTEGIRISKMSQRDCKRLQLSKASPLVPQLQCLYHHFHSHYYHHIPQSHDHYHHLQLRHIHIALCWPSIFICNFNSHHWPCECPPLS